jgi:hypothetical protein
MALTNSLDLLATVALHSRYLRSSGTLSDSLRTAYEQLDSAAPGAALPASRIVLEEFGFAPGYVAAFDDQKLATATAVAENTPGFNDGEEIEYSSTHCEYFLREMVRLS